MLEIKKDVPMPAKPSGATNGVMAVLRRLEVGDSFVLRWDGESSSRIVRASLYQAARRAGIGIALRSQANKAIGVWRTK